MVKVMYVMYGGVCVVGLVVVASRITAHLILMYLGGRGMRPPCHPPNSYFQTCHISFFIFYFFPLVYFGWLWLSHDATVVWVYLYLLAEWNAHWLDMALKASQEWRLRREISEIGQRLCSLAPSPPPPSLFHNKKKMFVCLKSFICTNSEGCVCLKNGPKGWSLLWL